jgi:hypothetical protein
VRVEDVAVVGHFAACMNKPTFLVAFFARARRSDVPAN